MAAMRGRAIASYCEYFSTLKMENGENDRGGRKLIKEVVLDTQKVLLLKHKRIIPLSQSKKSATLLVKKTDSALQFISIEEACYLAREENLFFSNLSCS
uniref:Uncharacterized protein n=1 Tax=Nelumbo nucifera TaxID=4432 RepID=A0A822XI35_NELNU|nr:TPA_asm: hypothetical protein HUJ06_020119 [Nelumbo nucifera]